MKVVIDKFVVEFSSDIDIEDFIYRKMKDDPRVEEVALYLTSNFGKKIGEEYEKILIELLRDEFQQDKENFC